MVDRNDDLRIGIQTSAITLGRWDVAAVMVFYTLYLLVWGLAVAPRVAGWAWGVGLAAAVRAGAVAFLADSWAHP